MSARDSFLRRLAAALAVHAARILPSARIPWAEAMQREVQHIEGDLEAFTWAVGCVAASYVERSRLTNILHWRGARAFLALLVAGQAWSLFFATALTLAYQRHFLGVAGFLGGFTPGDDYRRFIPLMEATPWWLHGMWVTGGVLSLAAAWKLLRNRRAAFALFAAAYVLGAVGDTISLSLPEYRAAFSFPAPQIARDYLLPAAKAVLFLGLAAALWVHRRCFWANGPRADLDAQTSDGDRR